MTATDNNKKSKSPQSLHFSVTGEYLTETCRHTWVSDLPKNAIAILTSSGVSKELALLVCTGKMKVIGDTNEGDGMFTIVDDDVTEKFGIKLDIEVMVERLEKQYIETSESINCYQESEVGMWDEDEDEDFAYRTRCIKANQEKLNDVIDQLSCLYPEVKKTFKNLPTKQVRGLKQMRQDTLVSERRSITGETADIAEQVIKRLQKSGKAEQFNMTLPEIEEADRHARMDFEAQEKLRRYVLVEKAKKEEEIIEVEEKPLPLDAKRRTGHSFGDGDGYYYITHCSAEKCKEEQMYSGWLLPDGTFYAGRGIWIHRAIIGDLEEIDFFKDKEYCSLEDDVQNRGGWVRMSSGHGWLISTHSKNELTKEQVEFIIDYTITVDKSDTVDLGFRKPKIETFAKLLDNPDAELYELMKEENGE